MTGYHNLAGYKRLYILGAGFSAPAQIPVTNELLPLVFREASLTKTHDCSTSLGLAELLLESLEFYCPEMRFDPEAILRGETPEGFDLERLLTYMGINSAVQMNTGEQLDEHGSQELSYFKYFTAKAIWKKQDEALKRGLPSLYVKFAKRLRDAMIFTFNWDTILEETLNHSGVEYELDKYRYCKPPTVPILKLHGSIDWFSSDHDRQKIWMNLTPVGESLPSISRAVVPSGRLASCYDAHMTPWIVLPSYDKVYQVMRFDALWTMLYLYLQNDLEIIIIGFSFRSDDYHTHAIMYPQITDGVKHKRIKVKVVDLARSPQEEENIRQRYAHIPECRFWMGGFTEESLDFIAS